MHNIYLVDELDPIESLHKLSCDESIEGLVLKGMKLSSLDGIEKFANLKYFHLSETVLANISLAPLGWLKDLRAVSISGRNRSKFEVLSELDKLRCLTLRSVKPKSIGDIRYLPSLRLLRLLQSGPSSFYDVGKLGPIEYLEAWRVGSVSSLDGVESIENLKYLSLQSCSKLADISAVLNSLTIQLLDLDNLNAEASLKKLAELPALKKLFVFKCPLAISAEEEPVSLGKLDQVFLDSCLASKIAEHWPAYLERLNMLSEYPGHMQRKIIRKEILDARISEKTVFYFC